MRAQLFSANSKVISNRPPFSTRLMPLWKSAEQEPLLPTNMAKEERKKRVLVVGAGAAGKAS